jgi:two-component sensor histidine kinase
MIGLVCAVLTTLAPLTSKLRRCWLPRFDSQQRDLYLQDAHKRVMSAAAVQQYLHASAAIGSMEMGPYLSKLCEALSHSVIGDYRSITLKVRGNEGNATCRNAESLGLIATELVINSLKHAFNDNTDDGQITVEYEVSGTDWKLSVADNGVGRPDGGFAQPKTGLGSGIVKALAKQLDAEVVISSGPQGTTVAIIHANFLWRSKLQEDHPTEAPVVHDPAEQR